MQCEQSSYLLVVPGIEPKSTKHLLLFLVGTSNQMTQDKLSMRLLTGAKYWYPMHENEAHIVVF